MKTPHKHTELIKAWADGAEIEVRNSTDEERWEVTTLPLWRDYFEYRIKPKQEPKPNIVRYGIAHKYWGNSFAEDGDNLKITLDGETYKLIKAEVLK